MLDFLQNTHQAGIKKCFGTLERITLPPLARKIGLSPAPLGKPYASPSRERQGSYLSVKVALPYTLARSVASGRCAPLRSLRVAVASLS
jgi:hypothetical protein